MLSEYDSDVLVSDLKACPLDVRDDPFTDHVILHRTGVVGVWHNLKRYETMIEVIRDETSPRVLLTLNALYDSSPKCQTILPLLKALGKSEDMIQKYASDKEAELRDKSLPEDQIRSRKRWFGATSQKE